MTAIRILAIILYGSYARGQSDKQSDVDVLVITLGACSHICETEVRDLVNELPSLPLSMSVYEESDFESMLENGSLFAHHLKLEGRVFYGHNFVENCWSRLKPFRNHHSELGAYLKIASDLKCAFDEYQTPNEFDLAIIFTIVRNTCIVLSSWIGTPRYGRLDCVMIVSQHFTWFPFTTEQFRELSQWKNVYERGRSAICELPNVQRMAKLVVATTQLVERGICETAFTEEN